jgi:NAD(P)-dependent dehydrogenase (short-subunit alcohol dehydrogenase family)
VRVVIVQPGLIRTEFAETASAAVPDSDGGPYGRFNAEVARATKDVYEKGPLARLGGEAEDVAKVIETAITRRRPRPRYRVTPSARVLITQRRLMTDRVWDAVLRTQFPRPGAKT